jgi:hypothetical protein
VRVAGYPRVVRLRAARFPVLVTFFDTPALREVPRAVPLVLAFVFIFVFDLGFAVPNRAASCRFMNSSTGTPAISSPIRARGN